MVIRILRPALLLFSCLGLLCNPLCAWEVDKPKEQRRAAMALDVVLGARGTLSGELRDRQGRIRPRIPVVLWKGENVVQRVRTDTKGRFQFAGLRVGVYRVIAPDASVGCRAWTAKIAPPAARQSLLLVADDVSARGQQPLKERFVANPFVMGTVIAAAIAIPIAIHNSGDDDAPDGS